MMRISFSILFLVLTFLTISLPANSAMKPARMKGEIKVKGFARQDEGIFEITTASEIFVMKARDFLALNDLKSNHETYEHIYRIPYLKVISGRRLITFPNGANR